VVSARVRRTADRRRSRLYGRRGHSPSHPQPKGERSMSIITILIIVVVVLLVLGLVGRGRF
jgi:hypothetical protein